MVGAIGLANLVKLWLAARETHLNLARVVAGTVTQTRARNVNVPLHHSSTEMVEPSFGNRRIFVGRGELY